MYSWLGRKITGNPCIGCGVREEAFFPERAAASEGMYYVPGIEFNKTEYTKRQVARTCINAFGDSDIKTSDRFKACQERASDPDALVEAIGVRLRSFPQPPNSST